MDDVLIDTLAFNAQNGITATGDLATRLIENDFDTGILRPWRGKNGMTYIQRTIINEDGKPEKVVQPVFNNVASLRQNDWRVFDEAVLRVAVPRLKLVGDLRAAGLTLTVPNGLGKTVLTYESVSNISMATISMDGLRKADSDSPVFQPINLPLPIIHKDFDIPARQLQASRNGGSPLDTTNAELAAERVAQAAEMMLLGTFGQTAFGGGSVYGLTNFPSRITGTGTAPTAGGWTPLTTVLEVLGMKQASINNHHFGPWKLYHSLSWDQYMDQDYALNTSTNIYPKTLRQRLLDIKGIEAVECSDFLYNGYQLVLVEQTSSTIREVIGMDITTLQWQSEGGLRLHFKVMAIMVPQPRADQYGNCGIVHDIQS